MRIKLFPAMSKLPLQIGVIMFAVIASFVFLAVPAHAATIYDDAMSYWNMDDNANNSVVADYKNANTGTFIGSTNSYTSAHSVEGKIGRAMSFDGVDDQVTFNSITLGKTNWTVSAWVKTSSSGAIMSNNSGGPVANVMEIYSGKIRYRNYDGAWQTHTGSIIMDNNWHFLTWVNFSNQTMDMYVDGVYDSGGFNSFTTNGGPINVIGRNWHQTLNGIIDDVAIWNKALSSSEINALFNWDGEASVPEPLSITVVGIAIGLLAGLYELAKWKH